MYLCVVNKALMFSTRVLKEGESFDEFVTGLRQFPMTHHSDYRTDEMNIS